MTAAEVLRRARAHVAGGWSEPWCRTASSELCLADDEGISTFSVDGALELASAGHRAARLEAVEHLEAVVRPAALRLERFAFAVSADTATGEQLEAFSALSRASVSEPTLSTWLEAPGRSLAEVLATFDRAIRTASRENRK